MFSLAPRLGMGTGCRSHVSGWTKAPVGHYFPKTIAITQRRASTAKKNDLRTTKLRVNQARLMNDIDHTCQWGKGERWGDAPTEIGMSRLSLSTADKQVRDWFDKTVKQLGCSVIVDSMGNQFAIRPGSQDGPPAFAGSHLDTQPSGGRYDGILGVLAGVEMLRVLQENGTKTNYPVGVVNWTNEEGARFPKITAASSVWAGKTPQVEAHELQEVGSGTATMKSELERIGYLGQTPCGFKAVPMAAHFELHIEQGPALEAEGRKIGIVEGVQAYRWFTVTVRGRESHTGTTPFAHRADALLAASRMIVYSQRVAHECGALASTGLLDIKPSSTNTVPGCVQFSLDIRAPEEETVETVEKACKEAFAAIARGGIVAGIEPIKPPSIHHCSVEWRTDVVSQAVKFDEEAIRCIQESASQCFGPDEVERNTRFMTSGAGHDSLNTSQVVPTGMIFVPCKDGISHNPAEYSSPEDCAIGAQVLMNAVLNFDHRRSALPGRKQ